MLGRNVWKGNFVLSLCVLFNSTLLHWKCVRESVVLSNTKHMVSFPIPIFQLSDSPTPTACPAVQSCSDTNCQESSSGATGLGTQFSKTAFPSDHACRVSGPQVTCISVQLGYKSGGSHKPYLLRFGNLLGQFMKLRKNVSLTITVYYKWYKWTAT